MKLLLYISLLFTPGMLLGQPVRKIVIQDRDSLKPLLGVAMLSASGSLIATSSENGQITIDSSTFSELKTDHVVFYNADFEPLELSIKSIPSIVFLDKLIPNTLKVVEVSAKRVSEYFTLKVYIRSWKLINNKLVRYGDATVDYQIPFERGKGPFSLEKGKFIKGFRNYRLDSIKAKSRIISVSINDGYFADHLPNGDRLSSSWSWYTSKKVQDSLFDVYDEGKKVGYALYDSNNLPSEISVSNSFEGDEALKIALWWKIAGKSHTTEKWKGVGDTRRPVYIFSNRKMLVKSKSKDRPNAEETVTEIFIDEEVQYHISVPTKYKRSINIDQSFYSTDFWTAEVKKHPLPSFIETQLGNIKELKNSY